MRHRRQAAPCCARVRTGALHPNHAFAFERLVGSGRLRFATSLAEAALIDEPPPAHGPPPAPPPQSPAAPRACVVLASHPSLRLGAAAELLHAWRHDASSLLLLTAPCDDYGLLLAPFGRVAMGVARCPLHLRLSPSEARHVVRTLRPKRVVLPQEGVAPEPEPGGEGDEEAAGGGGAVERMARGVPMGLSRKRGHEVASEPHAGH